ncbi:hypothetical protein NQZ68_007697 [Dissostichus eleginoides]|nr:hypothetical protein NQZ68_007697 [Dissostichus eleginoides]
MPVLGFLSAELASVSLSLSSSWVRVHATGLGLERAIYDSAGSSDVGFGAKGEQAVSSKAIQRLVTLKPFPLSAIKLRLGVTPPCGP